MSLQPSDFVGLPLRDIQVYLDVNYPGHRIFTYSLLGGEFLQLRIVGPTYNLTLVEKKNRNAS